MGVQGLSPWNVLLISVLVGWAINRRRERLVWDMPRHMNILLLMYALVVVVGFFRMIVDREHLEEFAAIDLVSEHLINTVKWVIPGLLLFEGSRSRRRVLLGLASVLVVYLLLAVQVIRWMPPSAAGSAASLSSRSNKIIQNEIGYSRVNMSRILAGGSWAFLAVLPMARRTWHRSATVGLFLLIAYAQALTGGRMGYVTWGAVGLAMCLLRWRRYVFLFPVVAVGIGLTLPGVVERTLQGFGTTDVAGETFTDDYVVTAGRTLAWPLVLEQIAASPLVGHGREAMVRSGVTEYMRQEYGAADAFPHPHNAYLELVLDNGIIGFGVVVPLFCLVLSRAALLFKNDRDPMGVAVGGVGGALILALLVAGMGSQTFYPREAEVAMWGAIGLVLRLWVERRNRRYGCSPVG